MLSLSCLSSSTKAFLSSPSLSLVFLPSNPGISASSSSFSFQSRSRIPISVRAGSCFTGASISEVNEEVLAGVRPNFSGVLLEETVAVDSGKVRLDSWISSRVSEISRARVQSSIRLGLVRVNGKVVDKASQNVKTGDKIDCTISDLQPLKAEPEDMPLDIIRIIKL